MREHGQIIEPKRPLFYLLASFIVASYALGGANENDWLANVILLYLATPLFTLSIYTLISSFTLSSEAAEVIFCLGLALLVLLLQLVPLPEQIWRALPFHDLAARALFAAGIDHPSGPVSLAPNLTWASLLSMLPPLTIFLAALLLNTNEKNTIVRVVLVCGLINAIFGLLQFSLNSDSAFFIYPGLSAGDAAGFFKNRNHYAAQMYALLPFAVFATVDALNVKLLSARRSKIVADYSSLGLGLAGVFIFTVSCIFARSRAGVLLLMIALVWVSFLPVWKNMRPGGKTGNNLYSRAFGLLVGFSVIFALEYGFYRILNRFNEDSLFGMRHEIALNTLGAILKAMPYGTGLGTFQKIYAAIEPVENVVPHRFVNRAHNDYLELLLETGLAGALIILAFVLWYGRHVWKAWRSFSDKDQNLGLTRASCITIGLLLLHSFVDYPLRTQALMGLFAMCCAFLVRSEPGVETTKTEPTENRTKSEPGRLDREQRKRKRVKIR